ncbi:hypothetical protein A2U01_0065206, partial [Trifolium medium]|nr:hypothetical protein [Trifolium medium]
MRVHSVSATGSLWKLRPREARQA